MSLHGLPIVSDRRSLLQVSQSVMQDYPDLQLPSGLDVIAGLLYVAV